MAYWPTRVDYTLPKEATAEIEFLLENLAHARQGIEAAKRLSPGFQVGRLFDTISKEVGLSARDWRRIFTALENLLELKAEFGSTEAAVDRLISLSPPALAEKITQQRAELAAVIEGYDENNPVSTTLKSHRLTYLRETLLHEAEIITDARPIFDATGENILQFVITHSLVMSVWADGRFRRQQISVDNADVLALRKACDRAIIKSRALKQALDAKWTTEILQDADG
jgi:hypothetical protein